MSLLAWGSNSHGQLGLGQATEQETIPIRVEKVPEDIKILRGSGKHTELISNSGQYSCGDNDKGQLRYEIKDALYEFQVVSYPICGVVKKLNCGWDFTLCLLETGEVYGWGSNSFGQLGSGGSKFEKPIQIAVPSAVDISCGLRHSAVVSRDGFIFTSGFNNKSQLGYQTTSKKSATFLKVLGCENVVAVDCGENFTLCLTSDGVFGFGDNKFGQIGVNPKELKLFSSPNKLDIKLVANNVVKIFCGWTHGAILSRDGDVITWGRNNYGQLGEIRTETWKPTALKQTFKDLVVGSQHSVGVTLDNQIVAWGWNEHGSCGDGTLIDRFSPTPVLLPENFQPEFVETGAAHSFIYGHYN